MIDNEKTRKTPVLRFKGFTDDWEQRKLGEITEISSGQNVPNEDGGKYYNLTMGSVNTEGHLVCSLHTNRSDRLLVKGTLIMPTRDVGAGYVIGRTAVIDENDKYYAGNCLYCLSTGLNEPYYIHHYMNSEMARKSMQIIVAGGSQKQITLPGIKSIEVPICSIEEQRKIAQLFNDLDKTITLHQKKVFSLTIVKKSMLEKMFPKAGSKVPEIRFYGFTGDWEQRKFSEIAQRESAAKKSSTDFPSVEYEDVVSEVGILNKDVRLKETQKTGIGFDGSQVLYGKLRPYLHNWLSPDFSGVAVGDWWVLKPVNVDKSFLFRLIQTEKFDDIANQSSGSKMPRADWNLLSNTEFMVPAEIEEERKIGQYFSELDHLITLHQKELDKLLALKKSMLSEMFPK